MDSGEAAEEKTGSLSAAQRRAEIRRRKLLMNSEDRMNRIVGYAKNESENNGMLRQLIIFLPFQGCFREKSSEAASWVGGPKL